jgi:DNA-binding PadR family transcriptional regulator
MLYSLVEITMSLEHAILGFLSYQPASGYDLKKFFDVSVKYFWSATQSQIYLTLGRMADDGWVRMQVIEQEDRPDRKVYHVTDAGHAELHNWLSAPLDLPQIRSQWLVQIFFAHELSDEEVDSLFKVRAEKLRQKLDLFQSSVQNVIDQQTIDPGAERVGRLWQITLDYGISHLEWELEWVERSRKKLRNLPPDQDPTHGSGGEE